MRFMSRSTVVALATVTMALAAAGASASVATGATTKINFEFKVKSLPANGYLILDYDHDDVLSSGGGSASVTQGTLRLARFDDTSLLLLAGENPLSASLTQELYVDTAHVRGDAKLPEGTSVTMRNAKNGASINLTNGPFTIPSGIGEARHAGSDGKDAKAT
jgi:hypothetical protein